MDWMVVIKDIGIGTIVGGVFVYWWKSKKNKETQQRVLSIALIAEMEALSKRWQQANSERLVRVPENYPMSELPFWRIDENYFSVFENNCDKIGIFDDDDTKEIISVYITAKGFVDSIRTWNQMVLEYREDVRKDIRFSEIYRGKFLYYYNDVLVKTQDELFIRIDNFSERLKKYQ